MNDKGQGVCPRQLFLDGCANLYVLVLNALVPGGLGLR